MTGELAHSEGNETGKRRRGRPRKASPAAIVDAIRRSGGMVSLAAKIAGIDVSNVYRALKESEEARAALEECRMERDELYEAALDDAARVGNVNAIMFYLERRMPEKYGRKSPDTQVNVQNNVGIQDFIAEARRRMEEEGGK